jgi:hypothetical protein
MNNGRILLYMMYSEQYNKMGILDASIYDLIGHTNNDYLLKCIYELKKCDRFSVFGADCPKTVSHMKPC